MFSMVPLKGISVNQPFNPILNPPFDVHIGQPGVFNIFGSYKIDFVFGADHAETIRTYGGDDDIEAGGGNDTVEAGSGNDMVEGGAGNDSIDAGIGNDRVWGGIGEDTIRLGEGNDRAFGGDGNDHMHGDSGHDLMVGGAGNDVMNGGSGHDRIYGGDGFDTINGDSGKDFISGGSGANEIHGGGGADAFIFDREAGTNIIFDYEVGLDTLILRDFAGELRISDTTYYDREGVRYDGIGFRDATDDMYDAFWLIGYNRSDVPEIMNDMLFI